MTLGDQVSLRPVTRVRCASWTRRTISATSSARPPTRSPRAADEPGAILRAIGLGELPVGVPLVEVAQTTPHLVRFMVDARHQRAGIGPAPWSCAAAGWKEPETSFHPGAGGAAGFWARCGFRESGRELHGEPMAVRGL